MIVSTKKHLLLGYVRIAPNIDSIVLHVIFFYSDGAEGTAAYKVCLSVEEWQKKTGVKKVKIGKIKTTCGDWFMKYGLPHKHCVAKARVCF